MRRLLAPLSLLFVLGCGPKQPQRQPTAVQVQTIGSAEFNPSIEVISRLSSTTDVSLRPEADGRVVKILVKQGQTVKAGEPILVLDNVQQTAALDSAKAEARKDRLNAERYIFLNEQGAVSTKQRDAYVTKAIQSADRVPPMPPPWDTSTSPRRLMARLATSIRSSSVITSARVRRLPGSSITRPSGR